MKALVIHAPRDLRLEEREAPAPGPGEVRVRIAAGGVCGSDLHYYNHGGFGAVRLKEPMILGHEVAGHVEALGDGVGGLAVGDLVAVSPSRPCGDCGWCAEGMPNHCLHMRFYGSAMPFPHVQGAFRQVLVADAAQCVRAEGLTPAAAAMAEPLAVCLHAARRAGELLGRRVLITGAGPIGVLIARVARRAGAREVVVTDLAANALKHAEMAGADAVLNMAEHPDALVAYQAGKGYFDTLFECSGAASALAGGIAALRPRGVAVQLGLGGDMTVPMQMATAKEVELRGSFRFHEEFAVAVDMMRGGLIDAAAHVTHQMPLADAVAAFETAGDRSAAMKVQIGFA